MENLKNTAGIIGLGTMGSGLLQNLAGHGFLCSGFDVDPEKTSRLNKLNLKGIRAFSDISQFTDSLQKPRIILLLVPAGDIVDTVLEQLENLVEPGDIIIDGGNSHFTDTERRYQSLKKNQIYFLGMGISGGEEGARKGPSLMPGGDAEAYAVIEPVFKKIAARVKGKPMIDYIGNRSAGHFVKMVHNGIEYGIMQLISEVFSILKNGLHYSDSGIHDVFKQWNEGRLESYLLNITRDIFAFKNKNEEGLLVYQIKDQARTKGTGKWTSQAAMDLQLPVPVIDIAVPTRNLSTFKNLRVKASKIYSQTTPDAKEDYSNTLEPSYYFAMATAYAQGMHLLAKASSEFNYDLNLQKIAGIWRGGCIIRSRFLNDIYSAFQKNQELGHLFFDEEVCKNITSCLPSIRKMISQTSLQGIATPGFSAALNYFENLRSETMPANLIQAQRDYFGSHTYELKGKKGVFHTRWVMENKDSDKSGL